MTTVHKDQIVGPMAWKGAEFRGEEPWVVTFSEESLHELDTALARVKEDGISLTEVTADDFPLPSMSDLMQTVKHELRDGRGFVVIRGFPVDKYDEEETELAFWALGTQLGNPMSQKATGDLLVHVRDTGLDIADTKVRGHQTNELLRFHTDSADVDIVGLLCLQTAKEGGLSSISSVATVHNELLESAPDLLESLYGEFSFDLRDAAVPGRETRQQAIFAALDGRVSIRYQGEFIESAQGKPGAVPLSATQREALSALERVTSDQEIRADLEFRRGDIQLLNNSRILHSRTRYIDHDEPERKRHLLRLWLNDPEAHPLPPEHTLRRTGVEVQTQS